MYENVKQDYTNTLNKRFSDNKEKLIEAFIEYYGEEYRDRIKSIYDNTTIVYYVGQNIMNLINSYNLFAFELTPHQKELFEIEKKLSNHTLTDEDKSEIRYIGSNKTDVFSDQELPAITSVIMNSTNSNNPLKLLWTFNGRTNRFIFLPSYIWTDSSIIHEMNHHMTSDELLLIESDSGNSHVSISGLNIDGYDSSNEERIIEELINDMSAIEITEIFHKKGGTYVEENINKAIPIESDYNKNFYLVEKFYTHFKDVIKKARITGSKNLLLETCGKENYYQLVNLVNKYYNTEPTPEKIDEIDKVYNSMVNYQKKIKSEERI